MRVITLTLNPAFDLHCTGRNFRLGHETFFDITSFEPGGKGLNISRALKENGVDNHAIIVVGTENGDEFLNKLARDHLQYTPIFVEGRIRENIILHDLEGLETRVSFNGFSTDDDLLERVKKALPSVTEKTIITLTGSIPKGMKVIKVKDFVKELTTFGAKFVIDCRSFSLDDLIELKPFLIKPNQDEISAYLGREIMTVAEAKQAALFLHQQGIEYVMITLGANGAVLANHDGVFAVKPPLVNIISSIGAGDSAIAGFIQAYLEGKKSEEILKTAVAFGTAACLNPGTKPPLPEVIQAMFTKCQLK